MSIVLQSTGGGQITLQEPTTASNFTQTLPAATGNVILDSTAGVCRAWVNFNGTSTVAIRASFNVSSITDGGTGVYTVNFTNAISDANYCVSALAGYNNFISAIVRLDDSPAQTTTALKLECSEGTGALADTFQFNVAIFR